MRVLSRFVICTALRAHVIVVEVLYKINYYYYYHQFLIHQDRFRMTGKGKRLAIQGWLAPLDNTPIIIINAAIITLQFSSVQFKMVSRCSEKPICTPPGLSEVFSMLPFKLFQCSSDWQQPSQSYQLVLINRCINQSFYFFPFFFIINMLLFFVVFCL